MELMKNGLNDVAINRIASAFSQASLEFDRDSFINTANTGLQTLELKERVDHLITVLHQHLPTDFEQALPYFIAVIDHWDHGDADDPLRSFAAWPVIDYLAQFGLAHPDLAIPALAKLTHLFSAEFAIRPFIVKYPELCQSYFKQWREDDCEHIRRLVSEGTRPRLPWGIRLHCFIEQPQINREHLIYLANDESLYVRRSVANHLNDIAKDHPKLVVELCKTIQVNQTPEADWLIKHATRTLVKQGLPAVFPLLGFTENPQVNIDNIVLSDTNVRLEEALCFTSSLTSTSHSKQNFVVDYAIDFVKANGKQSRKVFKLKNIQLDKLEKVTLEKSFSFKAISTRKYYPGEHNIAVLINGVEVKSVSFTLNSD